MTGKYRTIVIDPPWDIGQNFAVDITSKQRLNEHNRKYNSGFNMRAFNKNVDKRRSMPYTMMPDTDMLNYQLPIEVNEDACLFMWCVHQKLELALQMLKKWEFTYKYMLTWYKLPSHFKHPDGHATPLSGGVITSGFYRNSELLIFATKGKSLITKSGSSIPFVFAEKVRAHSEKPPGIYQMIREKTPEPRIDIFARRRHAGFDAWGDQVEPVLQEVLV